MKWTQNLKLFSAGLGIGVVLMGAIAFTTDKTEPPVKVEDGRIQYQWYPPATPTKLSFAGEEVPMNQIAVRESLEKQLITNVYAHSHILRILRLSTRIFPEIEKKLKAEGLPDDFKYLCVAESSLENPTSRAGAKGYWQFMTATGKHYGLEIDSEVDERYDLAKSTDAACRYLKDAYTRFGNWTAAAASYNCGMGGYSRRADFQMSKDYYNLWLPGETNDYIFRILALKEIISQPEKYGYHIPEQDAYTKVPVRKIKVRETIPNLAAFAKEHGTTYKMLRFLNPWLQSKSLTISKGNQYEIHLPKDA